MLILGACAQELLLFLEIADPFPALKEIMVRSFIFDNCDIFFRRFRWLSFQMTKQDTRTMKGEVVRLHICVTFFRWQTFIH